MSRTRKYPLRVSTDFAEATPSQPAEIYGAPDMMVHGLTNVRQTIQPKHPMEVVQSQKLEREETLKLNILGAAQGRSAPAMIRLERSLLNQMRRLPTLHSSMLGLEISLGKDSEIDFDDYLNDPAMPEVMGNVHTMTEASPFFK